MLPNTLNTNEVKNAAGVEVEFSRLSQSDRQLVFCLATEVPYTPYRITVSHQETGSGLSRRRRSLVRVDKSIPGQVDATKVEKVSAYAVADIPVGNLTAVAEAQNVLANLMSFMATTGSATTVLFDCSGYGAAALASGTL